MGGRRSSAPVGRRAGRLGHARALKSYRPERRIAYVVEAPYADLLRGLDFIDALPSPRAVVPERGVRIITDLRKLRATSAIDFHGSARSALITLASGAKACVGFDVRGAVVLRTPSWNRAASFATARACPTRPSCGACGWPVMWGQHRGGAPSAPVGVRGRAHTPVATHSRQSASPRAASRPVWWWGSIPVGQRR